jgi:uridine kinase
MQPTRITHVTKRNGQQVPFDQERITFAIYKAAASVGGTNMRRTRRLTERVVMHVEDRFAKGDAPLVEIIQDIIEEILITAGHVATARSFIVYRENRRAAREQAKGASRAAHGPTPYRVLWDMLTWNVEHNCYSLPGVGTQIENGSIGTLIADSEDRFARELDAVAEQIAEKRDTIRLIVVAGPSSSGKTTTTDRLSARLLKRGLTTVPINVDNYFRDLAYQPRDERGDYDYETPEAIDLPLLNEHLERLLEGETVDSPQFDFMTGCRLPTTVPLKVGTGQLALIDTLHGMYKGLTVHIPEEKKYKIYIEALVQQLDGQDQWIRATDLRLLRRMARDRVHRNKTPFETLDHWHYVRRSEKKHILPYVGDANFVLNGSFSYEIPLYRKLLFDYLPQYLEHKDANQDGLERATRLISILENLPELSDHEAIPGDSIVREFIGNGFLT